MLLVFASIPLAKLKKIQAVVKFYVFLIQKFECNNYSPRIIAEKTTKTNNKLRKTYKNPRKT